MAYKSKVYLIIPLLTFLSIVILIKYTSAENRNYYTMALGIQEYSTPVEAKDFTLRDINNRKVNLKDFRGKTVMLNFWATWCAPCRQEMPSMEKLYRQFKDKGFVVLSVASGDDSSSVAQFIKEYNITFPALLDADFEVSEYYKVWSLPTTYFISPDGKITGMAYGGRDWSTKTAAQYIASIATHKGGKQCSEGNIYC